MEAPTNPTRPLVLADDDTTPISELDTFDAVTIPCRNLKPGMIVLDDLDCAYVILDHKVRAERGSGAFAWFVQNIDPELRRWCGGVYGRQYFSHNGTVRVAGR